MNEFTLHWRQWIWGQPLDFCNLNPPISHKSEFPSPMDTSHHILLKIAEWKIYFPILVYVKCSAPYWGHFCTDFIFMHWLYKPCLKDAANEIPLYLDYWFMRKRALNRFTYISLCKMKRSLVGQGCCMLNISVFG